MPVATPIFNRVAGTPANPQFCELVMKGHSIEADGGSKPIVNIFHFVRETGPGTGLEVDVINQFLMLIAGAMNLAFSTDYIPDVITSRFMDDPLRAPVSIVNPLVPTIAGDRLPNFNAVVIRKGTYARGRSYRGSNHYGPIAESQTLLDNLTGAASVLWGNIKDVLVAMGGTGGGVVTADGSTWRLAVFSPTLSDYTVSPILVTGSYVKDCVLNLRLGTMKRRKDRTGPSA